MVSKISIFISNFLEPYRNGYCAIIPWLWMGLLSLID
jgi:hypothetical protein